MSGVVLPLVVFRTAPTNISRHVLLGTLADTTDSANILRVEPSFVAPGGQSRPFELDHQRWGYVALIRIVVGILDQLQNKVRRFGVQVLAQAMKVSATPQSWAKSRHETHLRHACSKF